MAPTCEGVRAAVREHACRGVDVVKIMASGGNLTPGSRQDLAQFPPEFRELRRRVRPGVTGLWQVMVRSDGGIEEQRLLDSYYVNNWSVWMDLAILMRTVVTVITGLDVGGAEVQLALLMKYTRHDCDVVTLYNPGPVAEQIRAAAPDVVLLPDEPYPFTAGDGPEEFPAQRVVLVSGRLLTWYGPSLAGARAELLSAIG